MEADCWQEVERIYHLALEQEPGKREVFLRVACWGYDSLRKEVESLLACWPKAEKFMESPAVEIAAKRLVGGWGAEEKVGASPSESVSVRRQLH